MEIRIAFGFILLGLNLATVAKATDTKPAVPPPAASQTPTQSISTSTTPTAAPVSTGPSEQAEEIDVDTIKKKYWALGNKYEMGVVQDRLYPKRHRIELNFGAGSLVSDPFLLIHTIGGSIGFHISEYFSLHIIGWDALVSPSSALTTLQTDTGASANTNEPKYYIGAQARASVLYGKLSLADLMILYFDTYLSAGGGRVSTQSGDNLLLQAGIGEQIHISRTISLNLDYQLIWYQETVIAQYSSSTITAGQNLGRRTNLGNLITLSVSAFIGLFD